ncbi:glycoside hydrolase family 25 protein [Anaerotruncus rubiinfantis]|uniref:glycoside hydrolase family 25 protein n=1 Tax=Anaerotruncus rubiinfantis TaxID=1720200 RepID=UPI003D799BF7
MMAVKGIDVSSHQGQIHWDKVKAAGYDFAIVRAGWSWYAGGMNVDKLFHDHIAGAQAAGLDVGVYLYSYDQSANAAKIAAKRLLELIAPYKLAYPVWFDMEYEKFNLSAGKALNTAICRAFLEEVQGAGYYTGIYASTDFLNNYLDVSKLSDYDVWAAQYASQCTFKGGHGMWQHGVIGSYGTKGRDYTIAGQVPGVYANCDVNLAYKDYPGAIKAAGLNGWAVATPQEPSGEMVPRGEYDIVVAERDAIRASYNGLISDLQELTKKYKG